MESKRCLFCDRLVPIKPNDDYDWYIGCFCAPGSGYALRKDSYETYKSVSYQTKRALFPLISGYIRELTDCGETVALADEDLAAIGKSPRIPATIDAKGERLLQFLHRHSDGPGEPVILHQLTESYNLTYSPNLQELIYIIEKLKDEEMLERTGSTFKLTETGWKTAVALAGGKRLKPCCVFVPEEEQLRYEWQANIFPKLEQCGYMPQFVSGEDGTDSETLLRQLAESKLLVADLSDPSPEMYVSAGYALGLQLRVLWTAKRSEAGKMAVRLESIRPLLYEETEELAELLQQRLKSR
ncbi:hypothetical protein [Paenibacillus humicola]|uniref:hypothetical protein n=1 Tax=Paenibacillus humicola TaxID=3110540 RepID=UPI00237BE158|nr:hypothetical protein [Paenibacillus humicola]